MVKVRKESTLRTKEENPRENKGGICSMGMLFTILMDFIFISPNAGVNPILIAMYLGIVLGAVSTSAEEIYSLYKNKKIKLFQWLLFFAFCFVLLSLCSYLSGFQVFTPIGECLFVGSMALVTASLGYSIWIKE